MKLEYNGERVTMRKLKFSDVSDIYENIRDREIVRWTLRIPHPYRREDAVKFIRKSFSEQKKKTGYHFGIVQKKTGKVAGGIGLHRVDWENSNAELGYWLGKKYWGRGFMSEAVRLILQFGFRELKLHRICAYCFEENAASAKVLEKCGFTLEGKAREERFRYNKWHNAFMYGILESEKKI